MFGKRIKLFNLMGFEVKFDLSWIIIVLLVTWSMAAGVFPAYIENLTKEIYWTMGVIAALGLFASVIFHELCHSIVARWFGLPIKGITLFIFGGVAEMNEEPPSPKAEFYMAVAGPAASIVIGLLFLMFASWGVRLGWPRPAETVIRYLGYINLVLAGFNLIPAFPLDGGRVLRAALWHGKKDLHSATRISTRIGSAFGLLLVFAGIALIFGGYFIGGLWWIFIGLFLRSASKLALLRLRMRYVLRGEPVRAFMKSEPVTVPAGISIEDLIEDFVYKYHFKMFPVIENGSLSGCITTRAIKEIPRDEWSRHTVGEKAEPCSGDNIIDADTDAIDALRTMQRTDRSRLMVLDGGKLAGVISLKDMLRFLSLRLELEQETIQKPLE